MENVSGEGEVYHISLEKKIMTKLCQAGNMNIDNAEGKQAIVKQAICYGINHMLCPVDDIDNIDVALAVEAGKSI